jgi:hypothetical protein
VAFLIIQCFAIGSARASDETEPSVRIDAAHPYLALHSVSGGEPFILDQHRGKKVVMLHFAAWDSDSVGALEGWKTFAEQNKGEDAVAFVGVIHDQHRDRGELFVRWKKIAFPVYHDPINLISAPRVNRAVCVDADGLVRAIAKNPEQVTERFIKKKFEPNQTAVRSPNPNPPDTRVTKRMAGEGHRGLEILQHGDALIFGGHPVELTEAIRIYRQAFDIGEPNAAAAFRLGAAYRLRFDSANRQPGDLEKSCQAFQVAAALAPRNDIYIARVRQLGIATDKKACAYGWVAEARESLGGSLGLNPEPMAIEMAKPVSAFKPGDAPPSHPPKIEAGADAVTVEHTVVYALNKSHGGESNLLLALSPPSAGFDAGKPIRIWFDSPDGVAFESRYLEVSAASPTDGQPVLCSVGVKMKDGRATDECKIKCVLVFESNGTTQRIDRELSIKREPPGTLGS